MKVTPTVDQANSAPIVQTGAAPRDACFDAADRLCELQTLANLTHWIESARFICDAVRFMAGHDEAFAQRLKDYDVRYNSAIWELEHSNGLEMLIMQQRNIAADAEAMLRPNAG